MAERNSGAFLVVGNARRGDICVQIFLKLMMAAHFVDLGALLSPAQPPAFFEREIIFHLQADDRRDAGKGKDHHRDHRAIAQADDVRRVDGFQEGGSYLPTTSPWSIPF
jgi:hypothetical protein